MPARRKRAYRAGGGAGSAAGRVQNRLFCGAGAPHCMVPRPRDSSQALTWEKWRRPWKPRLAESGDGCAAFSTRWREASMRSALVLAQLPHSRNTQPGLCALTASISASLTLCQPSLPWYAGLVLFHGEHAVEQEHALLRPMAQVAAIGHAATQVRRQFLVQIAQAGRHSHAGRHRERQSHRLAVAVIGVLAQDHHAHIGRSGEGQRVEGLRRWREYGFALLLLGLQFAVDGR